DVNDALGYKKKAVVVTFDPLALVVEKMKVSKRKEKVVVSSDSEGSGADDFSCDKKEDKKPDEKKRDLSKEINANMVFMAQIEKVLLESDESSSAAEETIAETKMLLAKKDSDEQVLLAKDQAWMKSSSDSDQEINANMVFMA
nr:hypothetical protein [Tanacetum cinerariifolium]